MDYTELFKKAIENKDKYDFKSVCKIINTDNDFFCGDYDAWEDNYWYRLIPAWAVSYDRCYGFLCAEYPVALLTEYCPEELIHIFEKNGILYTALEEPMRCDENILRQYVHHPRVFDESFIDSCDYSLDDERLLMVIERLETGRKQYIDSGCFMFDEIR